MNVEDVDEDVMMDELQVFFDSSVKLGFERLPHDHQMVYVIFDIVGLTQNGGLGNWVSYHHEDPTMVKVAIDAFSRIGHPQAATTLKEALSLHVRKKDIHSDEWDRVDMYFFDYPYELNLGAYKLLKEITE